MSLRSDFTASVPQEKLLTDSGVPYSIVRATQFDEFAGAFIESMTDGDIGSGAGCTETSLVTD